MKTILYPTVAFLLLLASAFTFIHSQDWKIADTAVVKFDGGDPSGEFSGMKGTIQFDDKDLANSTFDVSIDVASINTGNGMKNTHAKSEKWFDAEKYPLIKFTSSSISKTATGYEATGTLDMHGVQKQIAIPFSFAGSEFTGEINVDRLDYNINTAEPEHGASKFKVLISAPVTKP